MIDIINLSKVFSDKKLFENVNLKFVEGETYGIIGANGAGKSTFLKIIAGEVESSSGQIIIEKNKRISVLSQDHNAYDEMIVNEVVISGNQKLIEIEQMKNAIYMDPEATEEDYTRAAELEEQFGELGGYEAESSANELLSNLGIEKEKWFVPMHELKANEKVKVLLAKALFGNPDILILDEPTNHLDLRAIKWLENFLSEYTNIVIVVSHDSDFLDSICTSVVDIDFNEARMFRGNYSFWKESSQLALEMQKAANVKKEAQVEKLKQFIARFSANASKSAQATSRKKLLEKITIDEIKPSNRKYPFIRWDLFREPGKQILTVENLTYVNEKGETLFENVSFSLNAKEKLVILGNDDIAKTRFLQILNGDIQPTAGSVKWGQTIKKTYFPNDNSAYFKNSDDNILEWISQWPLNNEIKENADNSDHRMRQFLGRMLFSNDSVFKKVSITSGGEKARLMFSRMMLLESNFLLLDQPLDHLDTESIDSVIEGLEAYKSGCIFTTYNRAFVKKVANVILEIKPNESFLFRGNLEQYEERMGY
ncbi:ABC-F family ATP-binding cassette domain-containing protein [Mycoplasma phocimorsus]|uniref:ATP-binding cassette domain-containing protein n=1 Tax=Mycoplasma phocimorsus TaxID=3045839 RepID=A0AAJ1PS95_9MOLU|nr:ATP-binding cassette domain-containing protein [Mycoplasma phocimorsus]MDJ1645901.1 ATP-binding cassette domain-containing protein [Mycoplasma phocimorsus]MDJ1646642.1 ATP-binding cassette domain-containing protein [Mycoplasma phocimorsus]MDJ1647310.1 ATP-binding cassette domain-containing protein [Mycoplasma phocimorsus]MDJ1647595.1 ATP-binding cassette domain-containing protein [Mycoplasma phocimorsus]MDJ1648061.1 ATP-binding cassette domain-containing protein [Mycoplasma phocimorsus]